MNRATTHDRTTLSASPAFPHQGPSSQPDPTIKVAWLSLLIQFFAGGAALGMFLAITTLFSAGSTYDGLLSMIGAGLVGAFISGIAMVLALLLGLPLRLARPLRHWWVHRGWWLPLACAVVGLFGIVIAFIGPWASDVFVPSEGPGIPEGYIREPNPVMYFGSIGIAALGLCHLMIPSKRAKAPATPTIEEVRAQIDQLDRRIVELIAERQSWVVTAGTLKKDEQAVRAPARVEQVIEKVRGLAEEAGASPKVVERTYRALIAAFIDLELDHHRGK